MFAFFLGYLLGRSADGEIALPAPTARTFLMFGVFFLLLSVLGYWLAYRTPGTECIGGLGGSLCKDDILTYAHLGAIAFVSSIVIGLALHRLTAE